MLKMESAEEIERQISAQVEKFNEITRQLRIYERSPAYQDWSDSTEKKLEVTLVLWPNEPRSTTFIQSIEKVPRLPAWAYDNEEKFLRRKGIRKQKI